MIIPLYIFRVEFGSLGRIVMFWRKGKFKWVSSNN